MAYRMTPQRMAILEVLEGNRNHPSAEELHREVQENFPTITLATVYNTLEMLKKNGEVRELTIDPRRYDPDMGLHHHMLCRQCGRVADVHKYFDLHLTEEERKGFDIENNHIDFYGTCSECREGR